MTRRTRHFGAVLAAAVLPLALACDNDPIDPLPAAIPEVQDAELTITPGDVTIQLGERFQLTAARKDREGAPKDVYGEEPIYWTTSNADVVEVLESGLVEARALGVARITAGCGEYCAYATVTVIPKGKIDPPVGAGRAPGR